MMALRIPTRLNLLGRLGDHIDERSFSSLDRYQDAATLDGGLGALHFGVMIALFVLFIILAHRIVTNARAWKLLTPVTQSMAIGSWFIPLYCLKGPYDAIAGTNQLLSRKMTGGSPEGNGKTQLLFWWWFLFCAAQVIGDWLARLIAAGAGASAASTSDFTSTSSLDFEDTLLDGIRSAMTMQLIGQLLLIAAAIVGWFAVRHIAERQAECMKTE